jgi:predicted ATPase
MNNQQLASIKLQGYKSIADCNLNMRGLNVLIGPNGAGKSNFIGFFKLIQQMLQGNLQKAVSKAGGPDALLHFGRKKTESIQAELYFGNNGYLFTLEPTSDNRMMFSRECLWWNMRGDTCYGTGHFEAEAISRKIGGGVYNFVIPPMKKWQVYHFHDTSDSALVKQPHPINDYEYLRPDARNLATYLMYLRDQFPDAFMKIEKAIRLVAPFFGKFVLRRNPANPEMVELEWFEEGEDMPFKAHHLSDGTLRFMCLATVLLQPADKQAEIIIIDEPELGLHPYAITVLAGLLKSASKEKQIIVSTQSVDLLSEFSPEDVIVVNREGNQSVLSRLDTVALKEWLEQYSLGELWKKNLLGGRPS